MVTDDNAGLLDEIDELLSGDLRQPERHALLRLRDVVLATGRATVEQLGTVRAIAANRGLVLPSEHLVRSSRRYEGWSAPARPWAHR